MGAIVYLKHVFRCLKVISFPFLIFILVDMKSYLSLFKEETLISDRMPVKKVIFKHNTPVLFIILSY